MAGEINLKVQERNEVGSSKARRLRRDGIVPGVVNNDKGQSVLISINKHDFQMLLRGHVSENLIINLTVGDGNTRKVLLREVQHHAVTDDPVHAEFVEISMSKKMRVRIPIVLKGDPVGVTQEGGLLEQLLREVEVECLPTDLVESISVDVSELKIGKSMTVGSIHAGDKLNILTDKSIAIAAVVAPQAEEEVKPEEVAAEAAEAPAEPEVIGEKEREERKKQKEGEEPSDEKG